jgi:hypothetical protein
MSPGGEVNMKAEKQAAADALRQMARLTVELLLQATLLAELNGLTEAEIDAATEQGTKDAGRRHGLH